MASELKKKYPRVVLFTTPSCTYCRWTKQYLRQRVVPFKDVDVLRDSTAARDTVRRSRQQEVLVIDIGGKIVVGFDRSRIEHLLGLT
jgi:glutaredoxin 3